MNNKSVALVSNTGSAHQRKCKVHTDTSQAAVSTSRPQNAVADRYKSLIVAAYTRDISSQGQALDAQFSAHPLLSNSSMRFLVAKPKNKRSFQFLIRKLNSSQMRCNPTKQQATRGLLAQSYFDWQTSNNLKSFKAWTLPPTVAGNDVVMAKKFKKEGIALLMGRECN